MGLSGGSPQRWCAGPDPYSVLCPAEMEYLTVIFINKMTRLALICRACISLFRDKLSADIIIKSRRYRCPGNSPGGKYRHRSMGCGHRNNDGLLEKYIAGEPISQEELAQEEQRRVQAASCSQSIMAAPKRALAFNR